MECFIYEGGCGIHVSRCLKEELAWAIDKRFQFTTLSDTTRDLQRILSVMKFYICDWIWKN